MPCFNGCFLFAFECVSIERPLDYEFGQISTFQRRQARLDEKVGQALSLGEFIKAKPRGKNYDFKGVERIVPLVVSPRIVSVAEAIQLLEQARSALVPRKCQNDPVEPLNWCRRCCWGLFWGRANEQDKISNRYGRLALQGGGGSGIRTRDTVSRIHTFQACAFNHSATPPA
jgi:hypothetical protein